MVGLGLGLAVILLLGTSKKDTTEQTCKSEPAAIDLPRSVVQLFNKKSCSAQ